MMKNLFSVALVLLFAAPGLAQEREESSEEAIKTCIQQFFDAIEQQDTQMFKQTLFPTGQVWVQNTAKDPAQISSRFFQSDIQRLECDQQFLEKALHYDIKVHKGMAMAWVAYEFWRNGQLSHCGIDAFTLMKVEGAWKIVSLAYSVEPRGCEELR